MNAGDLVYYLYKMEKKEKNDKAYSEKLARVLELLEELYQENKELIEQDEIFKSLVLNQKPKPE